MVAVPISCHGTTRLEENKPPAHEYFQLLRGEPQELGRMAHHGVRLLTVLGLQQAYAQPHGQFLLSKVSRHKTNDDIYFNY